MSIKMENIFDDKVIYGIRDYMIEKRETIAIAESVTSGFMQAAFSTAPDASKFYQGGITVYNAGQKYRHLLIDPIHTSSCNSVSQRVADEMALNVCRLFCSDWGAGITGYATPDEQAHFKLFAHYAIASGNKIISRKTITPANDDPLMIQLYYVNDVLQALYTLCKGRAEPDRFA
jgi:nicotinamide-nucleotide amidase